MGEMLPFTYSWAAKVRRTIWLVTLFATVVQGFNDLVESPSPMEDFELTGIANSAPKGRSIHT